MALCSYAQYKLETTFTPIRKNPDNGIFNRYDNETENLAIVKVYYAEEAGYFYKTSVVMTWYEILSTFGGLIGLILGVSLIMAIEICYFYLVRFPFYLKTK